jgi:hypothetical protein
MKEHHAGGTTARRGREEEAQQVTEWRLAQFQALGFTGSEAAGLANSRVDLGQARELIASGCSTETAYRILS